MNIFYYSFCIFLKDYLKYLVLKVVLYELKQDYIIIKSLLPLHKKIINKKKRQH